MTTDALQDELHRRLELRDLVERYGSAADARDRGAFAALFAPHGVLVTSSGERLTGRAEVATVVDGLAARYQRTFHFVGRQELQVTTGVVSAAVTCLAHHLLRQDDGEPRDDLLLIEYADSYTCLDGRWRVASRRIDIAWQLQRPLRAA
ncbi:nuclear transport factor 2 family protein [Pseudonocardia ailaonensis]|uniref:Nuclear transport factor 2 family protein n=1 Tax=Pseudonocardia ailaonensis TaxID=367279 RepID=A0ABN2MZ54_9PSEU